LPVFRHSLAALIALVGAPLLAVALLLAPRWRIGWRERILGGRRRAPGAIWLHGASVGEILAAARLVDALRAKGHEVMASTTTPTGREVMRRARPDVDCRLAPLDHPWCAALALARAAPRAIVLIETELWPCWIAAAERRGIPVVVVSGRLSDRSFPRYLRVAAWLRRTLQRLHAIGARTELDRERFVALGAAPERVSVSGDLKLELVPGTGALAPELAEFVGGTRLLVAGSAHPAEVPTLLEAFGLCQVQARQPSALVLAPRHLERAEAAVAAVRAAGRRAVRRSELTGGRLEPGEVLVLDSLGELPGLYGRCESAFVGGTLTPVGGHNLLEPVAAGRPVAFGPFTANVTQAARILLESGAGRRVTDAAELAREWSAALDDPSAARARADAGRAALQRHQGSAERAAQLVVSALGAR
jgi:3-deoxy-D-manno-octulosonic-acid transferase